MDRTTVFGRIVFAVAMMAFGVEELVIADFDPALMPVPSWVPAHAVLVYASGILLILTGLLIVFSKSAQPAAIVLGSIWLISLLLLDLPVLLSNLSSGVWWTRFFEVLAFCGIILVLIAALGEKHKDLPGATTKETRIAQVGAILYGISLPVFGVLHFIYIDYVASVIPNWIPGHTFWGYFTAIAFFAASAGIISGVKARLAAILLAIMYGLWVIMLHIPLSLAASNRNHWSSTFVALTMCGGGLLVAGQMIRRGQAETIQVMSAAVSSDPRRISVTE
jgi:uncharacterized membrane protein YphA (DoxX/SURF4 family)